MEVLLDATRYCVCQRQVCDWIGAGRASQRGGDRLCTSLTDPLERTLVVELATSPRWCRFFSRGYMTIHYIGWTTLRITELYTILASIRWSYTPGGFQELSVMTCPRT